MVAHNGITNPAIFSETPFFKVCSKATGIVAAEDCVPNAVNYAGIIVANNLKGFLFVSTAAIVY